ncbi:MAG: glycine--tRNA ligase subunit beta [Pseudomonadota bacterium]
MSDFLLELRCEEIPARMQAGARAELEKLFRAQMSAAGVSLGAVTVWSTPRRLALIAQGMPETTEAVREESKGPRTSAPDQALEGFLRKTGLTRDQLEDRDGVWFAVLDKPGRAVADVLAEAIPAIIRSFSWPKSMRWGAASLSTESLRWVRPLSGIVAILGEELVPCEVDGIASGYATLGHRFHAPGPITIGGAHDYQEKLRACHVIVDHAERQDTIRASAAQVAAEAGLTLVADEGLVVENAGLTEWPVPLLGRFDEAFLAVPPEVIQLTARVNQKYFVCTGADGKLANAFVCTANITADDPAVVVDGNRKVLAARLSDARFFWEQDQKVSLEEHAKKLARITFHEKLGTVADKVERVTKLARWLAEEGIVPGADPELTEQAARLCKADLVTEMVGEFPELQGLMGGYYARAAGLDDAVADAIRDHYKPVGQGDDVPTAPVTVAVSLADKLDTLVGFFGLGIKPTGSKDPFALRRAAIAVLSIWRKNLLRTDINTLINRSDALFMEQFTSGGKSESYPFNASNNEMGIFLLDRLFVLLKSEGIASGVIESVTAVALDANFVTMMLRISALDNFLQSDEGTNLLAGYKRAANILKKEDWRGIEGEIAHTGEEDPLAGVDDPLLKSVVAARMAEREESLHSYTPEPAEAALIAALAAAEPQATAAIAAEDFAGAMSALATLRAPIDAFFESVTVNDPDPAKRAARLDLLARFRAAVHNVADFSRIEG